MNIALFGGTFDPVHNGHLALARAAQERFDVKEVHFVPANIPPHKPRQPVAAFEHRYAMLALATGEEKSFLPSLLEAPHWQQDHVGHAVMEMPRPRRSGKPPKSGEHETAAASYSIDTVRRFRRTLAKSARLFFLIGIDAFLEIATWKEPEALLGECEFIVGSRRSYTLADVADALPEKIRPNKAVTKPFQRQAAEGELVLGAAHIHLLEGVDVPVSATQVRQTASQGKALTRLVPDTVAAYIKKMHLYRSGKHASAQ